MPSSRILTGQLKRLAYASGFDLAGVASAEPFKDYRWQNSVMRDPKLTMAEARSILAVGVNELKFLKESAAKEPAGHVARSYAAGHEYNLVAELIPLKRFLEDRGYKVHISPGSIAEATIPLKLAAARAGLGWPGKHSLVITPEFGSWVAFGALLTDAPLSYDLPIIHGRCGDCTQCLDACPTGAIKSPYVVDMSLCLDEILNNKGNIPDKFRDKVGHRILSCDTCQEACPHGSKVLEKTRLVGSHHCRFHLLDLLNLDEQGFRDLFGRHRWSIDFVHFKRNVIVALGNSADRSFMNGLEEYEDDESAVLSEAAGWALQKLKSS